MERSIVFAPAASVFFFFFTAINLLLWMEVELMKQETPESELWEWIRPRPVDPVDLRPGHQVFTAQWSVVDVSVFCRDQPMEQLELNVQTCSPNPSFQLNHRCFGVLHNPSDLSQTRPGHEVYTFVFLWEETKIL